MDGNPNFKWVVIQKATTNFYLKDAFAAVQTPPSTYKFFPNPFNLAKCKPKLDPIYQKMKKDYEDQINCTGSLNNGSDGNSSCNCFEYMVEDVKRDFMFCSIFFVQNFTGNNHSQITSYKLLKQIRTNVYIPENNESLCHQQNK